MPYYPENGDKAYYHSNTSDEKIVSDYANCSLQEVEEMQLFTFWQLLRDAVVWNCNRSESGREYLENAYYFSQEKPDRKSLKNLFGRGGKNGK